MSGITKNIKYVSLAGAGCTVSDRKNSAESYKKIKKALDIVKKKKK